MEKLELKDFDLLGIIDLQDVSEIEELVTPVVDNGRIVKYLSRSKEYYNVKSMKELSDNREKLKQKITTSPSKKNFVILENMLNCSAKVYFKKFEEYIKSSKNSNIKMELEQAQRCLLEDTINMVSILGGNTINSSINSVLPAGKENCERRFIEMDNKAMLYMFVKSVQDLNLGKNFAVLTPGYGSMYIGPFMQVICGYDYSNMMKSKYIDETNALTAYSLADLMSNERLLQSNVGILLLDDNIGTGSTMIEVKKRLREEGKKTILSGAVQYNWRNYYRVSIGDKTDIERFNVDDYEFLTPFNYAGHKLYEHAVNALNSGGQEYIEYLNSKGYRANEKYNDIVGTLLRGIEWASKSNLELIQTDYSQNMEKPKYTVLAKYSDGPNKVTNERAVQTVEFIYGFSRNILDKDIDNKEYNGRDI